MIARLLTIALVALLPGWAAAHGEHGGAGPLPGAGPVRVQGYWIELLSHPSPLAAGQPSHLVVKLSADPSRAPVSGARVLTLTPATRTGAISPMPRRRPGPGSTSSGSRPR